jgi:hypothetical protein
MTTRNLLVTALIGAALVATSAHGLPKRTRQYELASGSRAKDDQG